MRKLQLCLTLLICFSSAAHAQDIELFGGYSHLRTDARGRGFGLNGINVALAANLGPFGVVADFSDHFGAKPSDALPIGSNGHGFTYLFGPQYSFRTIPKITPFVRVLFGGVQGARFSIGQCLLTVFPLPGCPGFTSTPETAFAMGLGGGIDVKAANHIWIRLAQLDYIRENFRDRALNNTRFSAGIVYRFGRK